MLIILFIVYFLVRLLFIYHFPLFHDEVIYIHWAQAVQEDWTWRFVSLIDGKQPLLIWLISFSLRVISDPIIASRVISVMAGAANMYGIYLVATKLFSKRIGLISAALYIIAPFYLVYDGLALMDSLLMTWSIYSFFFGLRFLTTKKWQYTLALGIVCGLGLLTKSSATFFMYLLPIFFLLVKDKYQARRFIIGIFAAIVIAKLIESVMRLSIYFPIIATKNAEFVRSISEVVRQPPVQIIQSTLLIGSWIVGYMTMPIIILAVISLRLKYHKALIILLLYFLLPIVVMIFFGKLMYPRHFLFMTWPFLIMAAFSISHFWQIQKQRFAKFFIITSIVVPMIINLLLIVAPTQAPLSAIERFQFFDGEPSGIGIQQLYNFFDTASNKNVLIVADKPTGILPDGIAIRYFKQKNVKVVGLDSITRQSLIQPIEEYQPDEIYLVFSWQSVSSDLAVDKKLEIVRSGEKNYNWKVFKMRSNKIELPI